MFFSQTPQNNPFRMKIKLYILKVTKLEPTSKYFCCSVNICIYTNKYMKIVLTTLKNKTFYSSGN